MKVINNHTQPLVLDSGIILAAAGTEGSIRVVESISDRDRRRYVATGRISVVESEKPKTGVSEQLERQYQVLVQTPRAADAKGARPTAKENK